MSDHLKSAAIHSCKNDAYAQLCKNRTAQVRLTVLSADKVFMFSFLKTSELQVFMSKSFILGGFIRKKQEMTTRLDR